MKRIVALTILVLVSILEATAQAPIQRSGFTTNAPGATINAAGSSISNINTAQGNTASFLNMYLNGNDLSPLINWLAVDPADKQDALGFTPQYGTPELTNAVSGLFEQPVVIIEQEFRVGGNATVTNDLDVLGSISSPAIAGGTVGTTLNPNLDDALNDKASINIFDTKGVGDLGVPGTNSLSDPSAFDALMIRRPLYSPVIKTNGVEAATIDWDDGVEWYIAVETNSISLSSLNEPTSGDSRWGGRIEIDNQWTNSVEPPAMPDGWEPVTGIWPGSIPTGAVMVVSFGYSGGRSNVLFDHNTRQSEKLPKIYGGTANEYGVADDPIYKSPTLTLSSETNLFPDFSQGPLPVPLSLSTNLFIADPTGMSVSGRAVELELPVKNTNTTGTVRIDLDSDWVPVGFTNTYHTVSATNWAILKLRAYGTTRYAFLLGSSSAFSGGESSPAWTPLAYWDFEEAGAPSGWTTSGTAAHFDWDYSTSVPYGSECLSVISTNTALQLAVSGAQSGLSEVWVAFAHRIDSAPAGGGNYVYIRAGSDLAWLAMNTSRQVSVRASGGTSSSVNATVIPTSGFVLVKMRYKAGGGTDAEAELWITSDASSGWGTSVLCSNGTVTDSATTVRLGTSTAFGDGRRAIYDHVVWSDEDIPASYFEGL